MKTPLASAFLVLLGATALWSGCAGIEATPVVTAPKSNLAGEYVGEWHGQDQSTGAVRLKIVGGPNAAWTGSVVFTYGPVDVPTTIKSVRVDGNKVEAVFSWEVEGTAASTKLVGELTGDQMEGSYESTTAEGAATGKWKATRVPARS